MSTASHSRSPPPGRLWQPTLLIDCSSVNCGNHRISSADKPIYDYWNLPLHHIHKLASVPGLPRYAAILLRALINCAAAQGSKPFVRRGRPGMKHHMGIDER